MSLFWCGPALVQNEQEGPAREWRAGPWCSAIYEEDLEMSEPAKYCLYKNMLPGDFLVPLRCERAADGLPIDTPWSNTIYNTQFGLYDALQMQGKMEDPCNHFRTYLACQPL